VRIEAWKPFLKRWSEEWLSVNKEEPISAFEEPVTGWLGFPPAAEAEVAAVEKRLGCALPPSFRNFLLVTDGWRWAGKFVGRLRGTSDIGWLRDLDPMWIEDFEDLDEEDDADESAILRRGLLISDEEDAGILFLDPEDVDEHGEWAAYELFSWRAAGPERHGSFHELMYDLNAGFHTLDRPRCQTQREWDARIEHARLASLAGEVDGPLAAFREAARFGRDRARVLRFQMLAVLGAGDAKREIEQTLSRSDRSTWLPDAPLLAAEVLPVLFAEDERGDHRLRRSVLGYLTNYGSEPVKELIADFQSRASEPGFQIRFGHPEFDAAVRAAIAARTPDDAWAILRDALPAWRPISDDHLAPISLLADPRIARLITPERGREILAMRRG
jgi:hypothetical protein